MSEWHTEKSATWMTFGPFTLQGTVAMVIRGTPTKATVSIFIANDHVEGLIAEQQIDGDPTLPQLRHEAIKFGLEWLGQINGAFNAFTRDLHPGTFL